MVDSILYNKTPAVREIPSLVGSLVRTRASKPHQLYVEITRLSKGGNQHPPSHETKDVTSIVFKNYFCWACSIRQKQEEEWVLVLDNHQLMSSPHFEGDAECWHQIETSSFSDSYRPHSRAPWRLYLHQPSPMWKEVELRHIKLMAAEEVHEEGLEPGASAPDGIAIAAEGGGKTSTSKSGAEGKDLSELCREVAQQLNVYKR